MAVNFDIVKRIVMEQLNVSTTAYGTYSDNPRYPVNYINDEIRNADFDVVKVICEAEKHPRRPLYFTTTNVYDNQPLPSSIGSIAAIRITKANSATAATGVRTTSDWIDLYNADTTNILGNEKYKHYSIENGILHLTIYAAFAAVKYANAVRGTGTILYAPDEFTSSVIGLALSRLLMKQEDKPGQAQFHAAQAEAILSSVARNEPAAPKYDFGEKEQA